MFGRPTLFPGTVEELDLTIRLDEDLIDHNNFNPFNLKVAAKCNNEELNELDEYVFSVRREDRF